MGEITHTKINHIPMRQSEDMGKQFLIASIKEEIRKESDKPKKERDVNKIIGLSMLLLESKGDFQKPPDVNLLYKISKERQAKKRKKIFKSCAITVCVSCALLLPLNFTLEKIYGKGVFMIVTDFIKNAQFIEPNRIIELPTTAEDPLGLRAECEKYGISILLPTYIPEGFNLIHNAYKETDGTKLVDFHYIENKQKININITEYDEKFPDKFFLRSSDENCEEVIIHNRITAIITDKNVYRATFKNDCAMYMIETYDLERDTLMAVLYSFN